MVGATLDLPLPPIHKAVPLFDCAYRWPLYGTLWAPIMPVARYDRCFSLYRENITSEND